MKFLGPLSSSWFCLLSACAVSSCGEGTNTADGTGSATSAPTSGGAASSGGGDSAPASGGVSSGGVSSGGVVDSSGGALATGGMVDSSGGALASGGLPSGVGGVKASGGGPTGGGGIGEGTGGEPLGSGGSTQEEASFEVTNPLILERADPWIFHHESGVYYFIATEPAYERLYLRSASTIAGLAAAPEKEIWVKHDQGEMGAHIWAPELHFINGAWYIHFAAGRSDDVWAIRPYVLENTSPDPMEGTWTEKGRIETDWQSFSLDATTFEHDGTRYLAWAQNDPNLEAQNTCIYIAPMSDPWTLSGPQVRLSRPEFDWERVGYPVNEGPTVIEHEGRVFMTYSASATDANYSIGLLWADSSDDLLDPASWNKSPVPFMQSGNGVYGPGHSMFTTSPEGDYDILVYHGRDYEMIVGDPLDNPDRHTRVQQLFWGEDGMPLFPTPVPVGTTTIGPPATD